jgi:hypothetical protein
VQSGIEITNQNPYHLKPRHKLPGVRVPVGWQ